MDKAISKRIAIAENISTPDFKVYRLLNGDIPEDIINEISSHFNFPIIVKPNDGGSTIGLAKIDNSKDIKAALEEARGSSCNIIVEEFIKGREITAAVLNGKPLPLVEIKPGNELYDYEAKYVKGKSEYIVPAELSDELTQAVKTAAKKLYTIIGCAGLARVDFILTETNDFHFLELNSLPGMTELSLAPMAAQAAGYEFDKLVKKLLETAIK